MKYLRPFTVTAFALLSVLLFFYVYIFSGFEYIPGDIWDGTLLLGLTDHWRLVFTGNCHWSDLSMFWPKTGTLAYSDTFFLHGVLHSLFCALGMDVYSAYTLMLMLLSACGFALMYTLLKRFVGVPWLLSAVLACTFVNLSPTQWMNTHLQLTLIWLCPGLILLLLKALDGGKNAVYWAGGLGAYFALLFFTAFYIPWFMGLFVLFYLVGLFLRGGLGPVFGRSVDGSRFQVGISVGRIPFWERLAFLKLYRKVLISWGAVFVVGVLPLLYLYLPALMASGGHSSYWVLKQLPTLDRYIGLHHFLFLWNLAAQAFGWHWGEPPSELGFGFTPLMFLLFLWSLVSLWRQKRKAGASLGLWERLMPGIGLTVIVCWVLMLKVGNTSLWLLIYHFVPGGSAVRAVFRFNVVLALFALLVIAVYFKGLLQKGRVGFWAVCLLSPLLLAEQIHSPFYLQCQMNRTERQKLMALVTPPPADAKLFYVKTNREDTLWVSMNAFRIAQNLKLKTVNGWSGLLPPKWSLGDMHSPYYDLDAVAWAGLTDTKGFYALDLDAGTWTPVGDSLNIPIYAIGTELISAKSFPANRAGWSGAEDWGTWSDGRHAWVTLYLDAPLEGAAVLDMQMRSYVESLHPVQRVHLKVNGEPLADLEFTTNSTNQSVHVPLPEACQGATKLEFDFDLPDAAAPAKVGSFGDTRCLGVGVERFAVVKEP